jgi:hypothetical protein
MRRFAEGILLTLLLWLGASPVQVQETGERRVIPVSVIDREGRLVTGLTAADFRGEFRGKPVKIVSVEWDASSRRIALVVDTSAGMGRPMAKMQLAWWAAGEAITKLPKPTRLALLTFDLEVKRYLGPTNDEASILAAYAAAKGRTPSGGTRLYDGIWEAARVVLPPTVGDVVFVLTDGEDTYSAKLRGEVCSALAQAGIRVYFFLVSERSGSDSKDVQQVTQTIAGATGGRVFRLFRGRYNTTDVAPRLELFLASMMEFYRVEVEFPVRIDKQREWKIEVTDEHGSSRNDIEVAYPRLLVPLKAKQEEKKRD